MKLSKKIISALAAGIMTFAALGLHLSAADTEYTVSTEDSRFKYTYVSQSQGTISVAANESLSGNVVIPKSLDGLTVTAISGYGFSEQENLTGITIPDTVTKVDSFAFNNCTALKTIGLPDTITNMGARPFFLTAYETALEKNTKSDFVILGGYILYKYTGNDSDIVIPDGVKVIANSVFAYDESSGSTINSVVFPDSTEYICEYAFWECSGITSLTFGSGIQNIKLSSFTGQDITVYGYMGTYAQDFATTSKYTFVPLLSYGESRTEIYYSNNLRQYYFSDEEAFSKDGIKVYTRNYNGTLSEITDWGFTSTPKSEY